MELGHGDCRQLHARPFCPRCGKDTLSPMGSEHDPSLHCNLCSQSNLKKPPRQPSPSPYVAPLISPSISLSSGGSLVSSDDEFPIDANFECREDSDEGVPSQGREGKCNIKSKSSSAGFCVHMDEIYKSSLVMTENLEEVCGFTLIPDENTSKEDLQYVNAGDAVQGTTEAIDYTSESHRPAKEGDNSSQPLDIELDPRIWLPPEPEDKEDDIECSVVDDDDDYFSDGTKWGQPTSLSSFGEEHYRRYGFREECQKALIELMNGRFKDLLSQLFLGVGGLDCSEEPGKSWLDKIATLSWEASSLIKPGATEGRAMDPTYYLKVKCVASGSRNQSQVIRGLVFERSAAHKHMPTKYRNPRLLLILQGVLGQRAGGLSSFDAMEEEKKYHRSTMEMIETCHPNVVLVEKTVSRDIQESLLSKGITLVFDMKLPRLERIARCTGSPLVSSADNLHHLELKQCDSFHIEKFVEEHGSSIEGGKRPSKTLMFLEGCPKPLGCTILLMGAPIEELKKVKCVVQHAIFLAHHLILETSFLVDQRAAFSSSQTLGIGVNFSTRKNSLTSDFFNPQLSLVRNPSLHSPDIPISGGFLEKSDKVWMHHFDMLEKSVPSTSPVVVSPENKHEQRAMSNDVFSMSRFCEAGTPCEQLLEPVPCKSCPLLSNSLEMDLGENGYVASCTGYKSFSSFSNFEGKELDDHKKELLPASLASEVLKCESEGNDRSNQEKLQNVISYIDRVKTTQAFSELCPEHCDNGIHEEVRQVVKDETESASDPLCILVLQSIQCLSGGTKIRKQPHLHRIKFYGDFDISFGQFLLDNLLNRKNQCTACGEPPAGHIYSYTHKQGKLNISVKQLPPEFLLSGESEGKLWMWTQCLKCEEGNGVPKSTKRVVMSSAARGLSLGRFFELGFSNHAASIRLSSCGHLLHRDCLQFYGLGSAVASFKYSSVDIYAACMPPSVLEFNNPNGQEWLHTEAKGVLGKGNLLFMEVMNSLQNLVSKFSHLKQTANVVGSRKELSYLEDMLKKEKSDFEALLQKAINKNAKLGQTVHQILGLNRLNHELLLELYVWDRRLRALGLSSKVNGCISDRMNEEQLQAQKDGTSEKGTTMGTLVEFHDNVLEEQIHAPYVKDVPSLPCDDEHYNNRLCGTLTDPPPMLEKTSHFDEAVVRDVPVSRHHLADAGSEPNYIASDGSSVDYKDEHMVGSLLGDSSAVHSNGEQTTSTVSGDLHGSFPNQELFSGPPDLSFTCGQSLLDHTIPTAAEITGSLSAADLDTERNNRSALNKVRESVPSIPLPKHSLPINLEDSESWVWAPFSETRKAYRKDLQRGFSQKFEVINDYSPTYLSTANQLLTQEMSRLHFPVDTDDNVVSVYEDEFSSIIACALASQQDQYNTADSLTESDNKKDGEREASVENLPGLVSDISMAFTRWGSSSSFLYLERSQSSHSISSDESSPSSAEGFFSADPLSSRSLHPEIPLGVGKLPGKSRYSVVCIHGKQFYSLRRRCCPSELDYISSLSRCRKWDAQGGKSGAYFAKTLDDRFIVKQIKKTELDSFLKFASEYFNYISNSLSLGNQTCLAKILGIYQVIIRQSKSGREVKIDLIVMENLFFGRNISRVYDLKGALHRRAFDKNGSRKVLLDQDFVNDMYLSPFYVSGKTKHFLGRVIWNDTHFLTSINVMDYSLLLGVDKQRHEIVFGIIDYLRQYTWDKHLETWVKAFSKNERPTVISPREYEIRFRNFMSLHILTVPDSWCSEELSGHCISSDKGIDGSSLSNSSE